MKIMESFSKVEVMLVEYTEVCDSLMLSKLLF